MIRDPGCVTEEATISETSKKESKSPLKCSTSQSENKCTEPEDRSEP
jgi:hypothetical protein